MKVQRQLYKDVSDPPLADDMGRLCRWRVPAIFALRALRELCCEIENAPSTISAGSSRICIRRVLFRDHVLAGRAAHQSTNHARMRLTRMIVFRLFPVCSQAFSSSSVRNRRAVNHRGSGRTSSCARRKERKSKFTSCCNATVGQKLRPIAGTAGNAPGSQLPVRTAAESLRIRHQKARDPPLIVRMARMYALPNIDTAGAIRASVRSPRRTLP